MTRQEIEEWLDSHYPDGCAEWNLATMLEEFQVALKEASCSTGGAILYYLYARKAIAAGKEYLAQAKSLVSKL